MRRCVYVLLSLLTATNAGADSFSFPTKSYTLRAYSEFMPAPRFGVRPYEPRLSSREEILRETYWQKTRIDEKDERRTLRPGLEYLSQHFLEDIHQLGRGETPGGSKLRGIPAALMTNNPYWPEKLPPLIGPIVSLSGLVLSRTQDDKGQTPWTVLGVADEESLYWENADANWWRRLLEKTGRSFAGTRILREGELPADLKSLRYRNEEALTVETLVTFAPIRSWPRVLQTRFLDGNLVVIPHPLTRVFSRPGHGQPWMQELSQFAAGSRLRVVRQRPFSTDERWRGRRHRFSTQSNSVGEDLSLPEVSPFEWLFDPTPEVIGLYGKPAARNSQVWGMSGPLAGKLILDGPSADRRKIASAREIIVEDRGKSRLQVQEVFPPMEVNGEAILWRRPWVSWRDEKGEVHVDTSLLGRVNGKIPVIEKLPPEPALEPVAMIPLTYDYTVEPKVGYEKRYWEKLVTLTQGKWRAKNNVDCPDHEVKAGHCERNHLPDLARDVLAPYYQSLGLSMREHAFEWVTDFAIPWWGGLTEKEKTQKNLIIVIPGTGDHSEAIVMADHYDTAYMEDIFHGKIDKDLQGHRHASAGADDNYSGTAALMEAASVLTKLRLKRDVWLVHLTGEEFPADCLGARALAESLVRDEPVLPGRRNPKIVGIYVLDMVGHSTDRDKVKAGASSPSVFQVSPGRGKRAERLAGLGLGAAQAWNQNTKKWNLAHGRREFWERSLTVAPPKQGLYPTFQAEGRRSDDPKSTLFNTDGQIFSDAGIPVVLFMENYDINRKGYHDTEDTLANIDLDYGSGVTRIAIESVAQAAQQ